MIDSALFTLKIDAHSLNIRTIIQFPFPAWRRMEHGNWNQSDCSKSAERVNIIETKVFIVLIVSEVEIDYCFSKISINPQR